MIKLLINGVSLDFSVFPCDPVESSLAMMICRMRSSLTNIVVLT